MSRDLTVDVARGIGMILVVAGHSRINDLMGGYVHRWIYSFHMPLFFLLAGYCFNAAKYPNWLGYVKRKVLAIWWPFVMCSLFIAVVSVGLYWGDDPSMAFASQCKSLLRLGTRLSPFWFLPVLFAVEVSYWWVSRLPRVWECAAVVLCLIVGGFCFTHNHAHHDVTFLAAMVWYGVGRAMREVGRLEGWKGGGLEGWKVGRLGLVAGVCFGLHAIMVYFGLKDIVSYAGGQWINPWVHFPACLLALVGVMVISKMIARISSSVSFQESDFPARAQCQDGSAAPDVDDLGSRPVHTTAFIFLATALAWIGRHSMAILAVHPFPGIYRRTWITAFGVNAYCSYALEMVAMVILVWLLAKPLKWMVKIGK